MLAWLRGAPNMVKSLLSVGLLGALAIIAFTGNEIRLGREQAIVEAQQRLGDITFSLSEQLRRDMQAVALVMTNAKDLASHYDLSKSGINANAHPVLRNLSMGLPLLNNVLLINAKGIVVASNLEADQPPVSVADRAYFAYHRDNAYPDPYVGESNISRTTGRRVLQITQRINGPRGEFVGIVLVSLRHDNFAAMFRSFAPSPEGAAVMLHLEGRLLARYPLVDESFFSRSFRDNKIFSEMLPRSPSGAYRNAAVSDGRPRHFAYRTVDELPIVVMVSQSEDAVLQPWRESLPRQIAFALLALVGMSGLIAVLIRQLISQERQNLALAASEMRFRNLFDGAADAMLLIRRDGTLVKSNDEASFVTEYSPRELSEKSLKDIMPALNMADIVGVLEEGAADRTRAADVALKCREGRLVPVEVYFSAVDWEGEHLLLGSLRDVSERKAYQLELERMASHDELTGVPKRALFFDRLGQALALAQRAERLVGVLFVDLDRFKEVNDTCGHIAGDELLRQAAARMRAALRQIDTVARYGGDEFVILLPEIAGAENIEAVAEKLCEQFRIPFDLEGRGVEISVSIGVAMFPRDGQEAEFLVRHADEAMYAAKNAGRNRVCHYAALAIDPPK
jgi:diguanylate cyclase (GGDEF)-like protein/PAS domain S-box-containing protein